MSEPRDPVAVQAHRDYGTALKIAQHYWPNAEDTTIHAATATVLIHMQQSRKAGPARPSAAPQAGQTRAQPARPAPAAPSTAVPVCPKCGGDAWDNRQGKKNPKAPDFRCKDKTCLDNEGRVTAFWAPKEQTQNTAYAARHAVAARARDDFDSMPEALAEEDDDLPF